MMAVLLGVSSRGVDSDSPLLLIYGADTNIPKAQINNTLYAAGIDYYMVPESDRYADGKLSIPEEFAERDIIVMAVSDTGFETVNEFHALNNVHGFVLVCPDFPGNASMEGINSRFPAKDIAIFAGRDDVSNVSDIDGARLIYERISGDDTVYGTPISHNGSECFISAEQNRYLSLSEQSYADGNEMLRSKLFLNELVTYLNVTHSDIVKDDIDTGRIKWWSALSLLSIFAYITSYCFYLITLPKERSAGDAPLNTKIKLGAIRFTCLIIAAAIGVLSVVLAMVNATNKVAPYVVAMLPVIIVAYLVFIGIKFIGKTEFNLNRNQKIRGSYMSVISVLSCVLVGMLFFNLNITSGVMIPIIIVVAIVNGICAGLQTFASKTGSISYWNDISILGSLLLPGAFCVVAGLILGRGLVAAGITSLLVVALPYILSIPVRRHANHPLFVGIVSGAGALVILLAAF